MKSKLFIIAGHNGAGKTTFLKEFIKHEKLKYIDADEIAKNISTDRFSLLFIKAGKIVLKRMKKFKKERLDFVIETTLSGKIWKSIIEDFKKNNYHITIFFIYLDTPEEAVKRIGVRINKEGHYVSKDVVYRRYVRSIRNFWFVYRNLANTWILINNSRDTPFLVAYGGKENYTIIDEENLKRFLSIARKKEG